jgi:uncharacterized membrane protein YeiH
VFLYWSGMLGIAAFSITGVIAAGKRGMDIFSIVLLGVVTALAGGTLRDIILDAKPVFWIADPMYLWISIAAAMISFFSIRYMTYMLTALLYVDALGLALFTVFAADKTLSLGFSPPVAVLMGLITGITGGILRDILTGRMPLLLGREFYATPALLGAVSFVLLEHYCPNLKLGWLYSAFIIFIFRILAIHLELYYPKKLIFKGTEDD